ncbi:MAG: hypothetical protein DMF93_25430 [Acidobacteria bacterium]|nr:MAG: hypothetical protein DMF93_25430 [Acidobacteriota bacterium]
MRLAVGLSIHTGWAACVVAGGSLRDPRIESRQELELLGDRDRFVFHRAADLDRMDAERSVARARSMALESASAALRQLKHAHDIRLCAIVAKPGAMPALDTILASHPRIHTAEGMLYRDVFVEAATANGLEARVVPPSSLNATDPALVAAGRIVGKPWNRDVRLAALAAWLSL